MQQNYAAASRRGDVFTEVMLTIENRSLPRNMISTSFLWTR